MGRGGGGSHRGGGSSGGGRGGSFRTSSSGGRGRGSGYNGSPHSFSGGSFHVHRHYYTGPRVYGRRVYHVSPASRLFGLIFLVGLIAVSLLRGGFFPAATPAGSITRSTIGRNKLDKKYVTLSDKWYDDSAMGWISSGRVLEDGLKDFYNETGVQPYLVITDRVNGKTNPSGNEVWDYANVIYDEMFSDEGHMVFVFQCPDGSVDYTMAACTGSMAKTVLDDAEALEILYDYIDYYFYTDYDEDEMFAKAFSDAGKRIMDTQLSTGTVVAITIGVIAVGVIILLIVMTVFKRKKEEAAETERILNAPLDKFEDDGLGDLKDKYN